VQDSKKDLLGVWKIGWGIGMQRSARGWRIGRGIGMQRSARGLEDRSGDWNAKICSGLEDRSGDWGIGECKGSAWLGRSVWGFRLRWRPASCLRRNCFGGRVGGRDRD